MYFIYRDSTAVKRTQFLTHFSPKLRTSTSSCCIRANTHFDLDARAIDALRPISNIPTIFAMRKQNPVCAKFIYVAVCFFTLAVLNVSRCGFMIYDVCNNSAGQLWIALTGEAPGFVLQQDATRATDVDKGAFTQ